jgi:putative transposase
LIAGDATVITKAGKSTYALGKFYSFIYSRAVPGLSFQCLSLICVNTRKSSSIMMEKMMPKAKLPNVITVQSVAKVDQKAQKKPLLISYYTNYIN